MSHRIPQIESTLKRALALVLSQRLSDPRLQGMITVTQVKVSPDLHDAYVSVSVLPDKYESRTLMGLRHAASHIHVLVCREVDMKTVPHLDFRLDRSLKKQAAVLDAIRRGRRSDSQQMPADVSPEADRAPSEDQEESTP